MLSSGKSGWAIFGTHTFGSQTPPPPLMLPCATPHCSACICLRVERKALCTALLPNAHALAKGDCTLVDRHTDLTPPMRWCSHPGLVGHLADRRTPAFAGPCPGMTERERSASVGHRGPAAPPGGAGKGGGGKRGKRDTICVSGAVPLMGLEPVVCVLCVVGCVCVCVCACVRACAFFAECLFFFERRRAS